MGLQNFVPVLICGGVSLALIIGGVVCTVMGSSQSHAASQVDVQSDFLGLGEVCTITNVEHDYETKRESRSTSSDSSETVEFCEDKVRYTFTVPDATGAYAERQLVSSRGEWGAGAFGEFSTIQDRCQGADGYGGDPVCGGACQVGQTVPCWRPRCSGSCDDMPWANCGNSACYKVIDPTLELNIAQEDADLMGVLGIGFFVIGGGASCFTVGITICIMRRK